MKNLKTEIIKKIDSKFIEEWKALVDQSESANFFNTYEWHRTCSEVYVNEDDFIIAVYQNNKLVGILPLTKEKRFGIDVLTSPGKRYLEKSSILVKDNSKYVLAYLIEAALDKGNLYLPEVSEDMAQILLKMKPNGLLTLSSINPFIEFNDNPLGSLTKKQEKRILGKIKRNIKDLRFGHFRNNLDEHLASIVDLEKRSAKKLDGKDSFSDMKIRKLFGSLIKYAKNNVVINFMYYKDTPFVSSFGLVFRNSYLAYHTSYDNDFRSLIPGKMITFNMLLKLSKEKLSLFDLGRGHNVFKKEFTNKHVAQYDFYYSRNLPIRGLWKSINAARRIKQVLLKTKNSYDGEYLFRRFSSKS